MLDYRTNPSALSRVSAVFSREAATLPGGMGQERSLLPFRPGAEAYKRDLPKAEVHLLDAGRFALYEIGKIMLNFFGKHVG